MLLFGYALLVLGFGILAYVYEMYEKETSIVIGDHQYYLRNHNGFWNWMFNKED